MDNLEIPYEKENFNYQQKIADLDQQIAKLRQDKDELNKIRLSEMPNGLTVMMEQAQKKRKAPIIEDEDYKSL